MATLRAYLAWVLFAFGTMNLASLSFVYATGSRPIPPSLLEAISDPTPANLAGTVFSFLLIAFFGLTFHLWWRWKS
jgi:hypothetical protein